MILYSNKKAYNQVWSPMGRYPMVDNSQFETYNEALTFATTNSVAVVGSIITVTNDPDKTKRGVYELIYTGDATLTKDTQPTDIKKVGDVDLSNYVTKDQLTNIYTYKGTKSTYAELPATNNKVGDVWNVTSESIVNITSSESTITYPPGTNFAWTGEDWDALGGSVDLSKYVLLSDYTSELNSLKNELYNAIINAADDKTTTSEETILTSNPIISVKISDHRDNLLTTDGTAGLLVNKTVISGMIESALTWTEVGQQTS